MGKKKFIKLFLSAVTIVFFFISLSFSLDKIGVHWFWESNPVVSIIFLFLGIISGYFWLRLLMNLSDSNHQ